MEVEGWVRAREGAGGVRRLYLLEAWEMDGIPGSEPGFVGLVVWSGGDDIDAVVTADLGCWVSFGFGAQGLGELTILEVGLSRWVCWSLIRSLAGE